MNAPIDAGARSDGAATQRRPLIAHVVYRFDVGGLENGVVNLINQLPADRYDHAVIALTEVTDFRKRITRERVSFHALHKPPGHGLAIYRDLYRLFRTLGPAIVHTRNIAASEAQLPAALAGVPVRIHGEHGWEMHDVVRGGAGGKRSHHLQRRLLRPLIHRQVALSGEIRGYLEDRIGVPSKDIAQICNGVDVIRFAPRDRAAGRPGPVGERFPEADLFVIGTVGRLSPVKHQRLLVEAFARTCKLLGVLAPERAARLRLIIAGDGPDRAALDAQVAASGYAGQVWMTGTRDDVPALMADLDLFVLPSLAEGISNTILEAMACGLPVVATRVGGNAELIEDGRTGTLVASDDPQAMEIALRAYATNAPRVEAEGRAARLRAASYFSIDAMVSHYAALYDTLLDARRPPLRAGASAPATANVAGHRHG
ncbi:MAG: TIGR03088 family PEP-CTERM/XrtA system glycosyltransferase [Burkholderiaceae bacterium]